MDLIIFLRHTANSLLIHFRLSQHKLLTQPLLIKNRDNIVRHESPLLCLCLRNSRCNRHRGKFIIALSSASQHRHLISLFFSCCMILQPRLRKDHTANTSGSKITTVMTITDANPGPGGVGAAASGCPFASFLGSGAAPAYVAQNSNFAEVLCGPNNKNCDAPSNNNQGLQTNHLDNPCLDEVAPDNMTCAEVASSWTLGCQDSAAAAENLANGFKCGCMSDMVQSQNYCQRTCGLCSPVFVNQQVITHVVFILFEGACLSQSQSL